MAHVVVAAVIVEWTFEYFVSFFVNPLKETHIFINEPPYAYTLGKINKIYDESVHISSSTFALQFKEYFSYVVMQSVLEPLYTLI